MLGSGYPGGGQNAVLESNNVDSGLPLHRVDKDIRKVNAPCITKPTAFFNHLININCDVKSIGMDQRSMVASAHMLTMLFEVRYFRVDFCAEKACS
jgi:hypothetical protein